MAFAPVFQRPFSGTFDRHAAAAAAAAWYVVAGKTCVAAYQPKGAASLAASYTNLANPGTYDAAPGVAPTWDTATGWTFNGSSQYLSTGVVLPDGTWTMIVALSNGLSTGIRCAMGKYYSYRNYIRPTTIGNHNYGYGNGQLTVSGAVTSGVMCLAGPNAYLNGIADGVVSGTFTYENGVLFIGAENQGSAANYFSGNIQAVAIYSATLTAGEVATVSAAMAAL